MLPVRIRSVLNRRNDAAKWHRRTDIGAATVVGLIPTAAYLASVKPQWCWVAAAGAALVVAAATVVCHVVALAVTRSVEDARAAHLDDLMGR